MNACITAPDTLRSRFASGRCCGGRLLGGCVARQRLAGGGVGLGTAGKVGVVRRARDAATSAGVFWPGLIPAMKALLAQPPALPTSGYYATTPRCV